MKELATPAPLVAKAETEVCSAISNLLSAIAPLYKEGVKLRNKLNEVSIDIGRLIIDTARSAEVEARVQVLNSKEAKPNGGTVPWLQPTIYDLSLQQARWAYWTRFMEGIARYRANFTAGYTTANVPPVLKQAALQIVFRAYHARGAETGGGAKGASMQFGDFLTSDIAKMIAPFSLKSRARA